MRGRAAYVATSHEASFHWGSEPYKYKTKTQKTQILI